MARHQVLHASKAVLLNLAIRSRFGVPESSPVEVLRMSHIHQRNYIS